MFKILLLLTLKRFLGNVHCFEVSTKLSIVSTHFELFQGKEVPLQELIHMMEKIAHVQRTPFSKILLDTVSFPKVLEALQFADFWRRVQYTSTY